MDSIYIVCENTEQSSTDLFHQVLDVVVKQRLLISHTSYNDDKEIPLTRVKAQKLHLNEFNEEVYPEVEVFIFESTSKSASNNNFLISQNAKDYYSIISLRCREHLFLLNFVIEIMKTSDNFLVCNVENKLMSLEELKECRNQNEYGWAYQEA